MLAPVIAMGRRRRRWWRGPGTGPEVRAGAAPGAAAPRGAVASLTLAACACACASGTTYHLQPPAGAAPRGSSVTARVPSVAVTPELDRPGNGLSSESRVVVELEVCNGDARRPARVGRPSLRVEDALGGAPTWAGPLAED